MSFDKLIPITDVREKTVSFEIGGEKVEFKAIQIPYFSLETIATNSKLEDKNHFASMVAEGVIDAVGKKMTYEQAIKLPKEYARPLFEAVLEVNGFKDAEKN